MVCMFIVSYLNFSHYILDIESDNVSSWWPMSGFFLHHAIWKRQKKDWRETRNSIQTRVMLECEREYQEHLLLSVMPAYIAAEVSKGFADQSACFNGYMA